MHPRLFELPWSLPLLGSITVYTYGVLLAAAYLLGLQLARVRAQNRGLDSNRVLDLGIYIIISALVGAKLLLVITDFKSYTADPRELLTLARSGGVFYGGLIVAVIVALHAAVRDLALHHRVLPRRRARHGRHVLDVAVHLDPACSACDRDAGVSVARDYSGPEARAQSGLKPRELRTVLTVPDDADGT